MIPKIVWPNFHEKGNPFGGKDGFRPLTITFHNPSLVNLSDDENRALEMLFGLATLEHLQAISFDGEIFPSVSIEPKASEDGFFNVQIIDSSQKITEQSRIHKSWVEDVLVVRIMNLYGLHDEVKFVAARQILLEARTHVALNRDVFVTASEDLINNRHNLEDVNIMTPLEALKIVSLYFRTRDEDEWISEVKGIGKYKVSKRIFYQFLARGLLPSSWKYISSFVFHSEHERLIELGWSIMSRCIRALQARDEIARLFYMPGTSSTQESISYHFDYLTLLITAAFDVQARIINILYNLNLKDNECGLRRDSFKKKIKSVDFTKEIGELLDKKAEFIDILFAVRNMIHSVSLGDDKSIPEDYPNEFLDKIYRYDSNSHWVIKKEKLNKIRNGNPPVPSFNFSVDKYFLACSLLDEALELIDLIMQKTNPEDYLEKADLLKIKTDPPVDMLPYIQLYLLQGQ